jgi:hypothetical protein
MNKFDFISVLVSIVFGLGLTHLCGGAFQLAYRRELGTISMLLAGLTFVVIVLNWWMFFAWHTRTQWTFEALLVLVAWALSFYGMAFALFPGVPFVAQYAVCAVVLHRAISGPVRITVAWWMFLSVLLWSLVVRRHLGQ